MKDPNFNSDTFYVPANEDIWNLSGIVVVLSGELREERRPISFISKKEDVTKVNTVWKFKNFSASQIFREIFLTVLFSFFRPYK